MHELIRPVNYFNMYPFYLRNSTGYDIKSWLLTDSEFTDTLLRCGCNVGYEVLMGMQKCQDIRKELHSIHIDTFFLSKLIWSRLILFFVSQVR